MVTWVGRQRVSGWSVAFTETFPGWFRDKKITAQYFKRDNGRYWEDEKGWYVEPGSELDKELNEAIVPYADWRVQPK